MVEQTDAEFIADIAEKAEKATADIEENWSISPALSNLMGEAAIAIPRLIAMVGAEKGRAEKAEAERDEWKNVVFLQVEHTRTLTGKLISERDTALAEVARLRNAVDFASAPVSGWRPMESAPRDGTLFLAAWQPLPAPPKGREGE